MNRTEVKVDQVMKRPHYCNNSHLLAGVRLPLGQNAKKNLKITVFDVAVLLGLECL